jgi:hypothetical protein
VRQARELVDRHSHDPEQAISGEVAITGDNNDANDDANDDVKAEMSAEGE